MNTKLSKKDNSYCCVPQCCSRGTKDPTLSFHKFPNEKNTFLEDSPADGQRVVNQRKEWVRVLRIGKKISRRMSVCSKHFTNADYNLPPNMSQRPRLKASAVPSQFLPQINTDESKKTLHEKEKAERLARYEEIKRKKERAVQESSSFLTELGEQRILEEEQETAIEKSYTEDDMSAADGLILLNEMGVKKIDKKIQVCSGDLKLSYIIKSDDLTEHQLKSLTGLVSLAQLQFLSEEVNVFLKITRKHNLPVKERIILSMMKMKLNVSFSSLSIFFGCSVKTASNIFFYIIPVLSSILGIFIMWPTKEEILANLPHIFQDFSNVRIIVDCTEILVQKPKCLTERLGMYSQYYGDNTVKFLIGVSPAGTITYVSKGYGGRASDKLIFSESGLIQMLEPSVDAIMADKGFLIEEICENNFIQLIRPPFLRNKKQFSCEEAKLCRKIASARVHVERVIQRIKLFNIFKSTLPYHLLNLIDPMMTIAAALTNLSSPILAEDKY